MKLLISVSKKDIFEGMPGDSCNCPIARAVKRRITTNVLHVHSGKVHIRPDYFSRYEECLLPEKAYYFYCAFDEHRLVKPIRFTLEVPDSVVKK